MRLPVLLLLGMTVLGSSDITICPNSSALNVALIGGERRGCCSHHGGVCGCEKGRALCCDGRL